MQKNALDTIINFISQKGLIGVLCLLIVYYFGSFGTQLTTIQKQILEIKIVLAHMQEKYLDKEKAQDMIDNAIDKNNKIYHSENNK